MYNQVVLILFEWTNWSRVKTESGWSISHQGKGSSIPTSGNAISPIWELKYPSPLLRRALRLLVGGRLLPIAVARFDLLLLSSLFSIPHRGSDRHTTAQLQSRWLFLFTIPRLLRFLWFYGLIQCQRDWFGANDAFVLTIWCYLDMFFALMICCVVACMQFDIGLWIFFWKC